MFSLDSHNDLIRVTCDCGKVHLMRTPEVRRHDCPLTGKAEIYWPEGYVAERKEKPAPAPPSLARKAVNFGKAIVHHVRAGVPQASDEAVAERFAICQGCELFETKGEGVGQCNHKTCGCALKRVGLEGRNKLRWADSKCPIGKWSAVEPTPPPSAL
jgi:hypothetical protein